MPEKLPVKNAGLAARPDNKNIPPRQSIVAQALSRNWFIWVGGNDPSAWDNLSGRTRDVEEDYSKLETELNSTISGFSQKPRRNGKPYWYQWVGHWKYVGAVDSKHDPREPLCKRLAVLQDERNRRVKDMESCVVKKLGDHLLVNIKKFRTHIHKALPDDSILVKDVLSGTPGGSLSQGGQQEAEKDG